MHTRPHGLYEIFSALCSSLLVTLSFMVFKEITDTVKDHGLTIINYSCTCACILSVSYGPVEGVILERELSLGFPLLCPAYSRSGFPLKNCSAVQKTAYLI